MGKGKEEKGKGAKRTKEDVGNNNKPRILPDTMLQEELRMHRTFYISSSISMSRFRSNAQSTNWEKRTLKKGVVSPYKFVLTF